MENNDQAPDLSGAQPFTSFFVKTDSGEYILIGLISSEYFLDFEPRMLDEYAPLDIDFSEIESRIAKHYENGIPPFTNENRIRKPEEAMRSFTATGILHLDLKDTAEKLAAALQISFLEARSKIETFISQMQNAKPLPPLEIPSCMLASCGPGDRGRNDGDDGPPKGYRGYIPAPETYKSKKHRNNGKQFNGKRRRR